MIDHAKVERTCTLILICAAALALIGFAVMCFAIFHWINGGPVW